MQSPSALLPTFHTSLQSFASSPSTFLILHTIPTSAPPSSISSQIKTVHVLDSSFNPPTRAHLRIALSALQSTKNASKPQRLLLLLATQNADKAAKPAAFEQRLAMMTILARDILDQYHSDATSQGSTAENGMDEESLLAVDIGVTKYPYFHDKAISIDDSKYYTGPATGQQPQQVHLLGFDSLVRLLDTKYYPPTHTLDPLSALFSKHRIRVTRRLEDGNKYGTAEEQDRMCEALARGERESEGGKREWAERIEMVEGEGEAVSSTKVREGVGKGDLALVERLVGKGVGEHVRREGLYVADDKGG